MAGLIPQTSLYGNVYDNTPRAINPGVGAGVAPTGNPQSTTPDLSGSGTLPAEFWALSGGGAGQKYNHLLGKITALQNKISAGGTGAKAQKKLTSLQSQIGKYNPNAVANGATGAPGSVDPLDPNAPLPNVPYDAKDPNSTLSAITQRNYLRQERYYQPVENSLIASLNDRSILNDARQQAGTVAQDAGLRAARQTSRYNLGGLTPEQKLAQDRNAALTGSLSSADILNNGRAAQADRNDSLRNQLINVGRGVATDATGLLTSSASNQSQLQNANRAQSAASNAAKYQTYGTAAAALLAFL